ncbi:unnamed protein product [Allacma fusca]|uniref:ribonuclease III n=1 Tax=Allacma fusca TaxID=39272 RepID=A0A8J2PIL2_9HEXA|nr:unnamed protein product [Allacma fusca]
MSFFNIDVHSEIFTPQEYAVEILEAAKNQDVVCCCLPSSSKQFVAFMIFKEFYYRSNGIAVFVQEDDPVPAEQEGGNEKGELTVEGQEQEEARLSDEKAGRKYRRTNIPFQNLSSIPVVVVDSESFSPEDVYKQLVSSSVVICSKKSFLRLLKFVPEDGAANSKLVRNLSLVVIDNVHQALNSTEDRRDLKEILGLIRRCNDTKQGKSAHLRTRIVSLTISLLQYYRNESYGFWRMEETFKNLEELCGARVDTSSNMTALLRYSVVPSERILPYDQMIARPEGMKLVERIQGIIAKCISFVSSHSYDPLAEFGYDPSCMPEKPVKVPDTDPDSGDEVDSLAEELKSIPDPRAEPLRMLRMLQGILEEFGPWCMDRALMLFAAKVEEFRVQTPYERHYLLFGLLFTTLNTIHILCQHTFAKYEPLQVIEIFCTPKLLSVLQILRRFDLSQPYEPRRKIIDPNNRDDNDDSFADSSTVNSVKSHMKQHHKKKRPVKETDKCKPKKLLKPKVKFSSEPLNQQAVIIPPPPATTLVDNETIKQVDSKSSLDVKDKEEAPQNGPTEDQATDDLPSLEIKDSSVVEVTTCNVETCKPASCSEVSNSISVKVEEVPKCNDAKISGPPQRSDRRHYKGRFSRRTRYIHKIDESTLCGVILLEDRFNAKLLYHFIQEVAESDPRLVGLRPVIALPLSNTYGEDTDDAEREYKRREDSLRRFRYREANLLIGTTLLEEGIELPKANLVIRFDEPKSFRSYLFSKGRAQAYDGEYYVFTMQADLSRCLKQLATFKLVEEMLLTHSIIPKPITTRFPSDVDKVWLTLFPRFKAATLLNAVAVVNRYCARLPSDTFTRLTPVWSMCVTNAADDEDDEKHYSESERRYSCTLRLPINSPVKWAIPGVPMPSEVLAKRAVALQTVVVLHSNGEIDDMLMPIGKEGVCQEPDLCTGVEQAEEEFGEFRPGSTKRRQYYDKQLAPELTSCLPQPTTPICLYWIKMLLTCPLPDEQNTRGRRLHPPEIASQCFGMILGNEIPTMPPFPIYTRCGEVQIQLVKVMTDPDVEISAEKLEKISAFHHYTFTSVLRLNKYLTLFDPGQAENAYYVVPLKGLRPGSSEETSPITGVDIDWDFINAIWKEKDSRRPSSLKDDERKEFSFDRERYVDAVVMPWYRSNDQPQYFYVAEICDNLTPRSQFPGCEFKTFEEYYQRKYSISIQDPTQPLLDVDHTSARLNFLTPRYVNRKGMALPTSSETTKKAKRENLEQKQILVPELCSIHPFSASLWRQAVSLPCILYRMNSLLLANNIRVTVASQIKGLGSLSLSPSFTWEPLSFGWTLSDVISSFAALKSEEEPKIIERASDVEKVDKEDKPAKKETQNETPEAEANVKKDSVGEDKEVPEEEPELTGFAKAAKEAPPPGITLAESLLLNDGLGGKSVNEILYEEMKKCRQPEMVIDTWSNDMAAAPDDVGSSDAEFNEDEDELFDPTVALPSNLTMISKNWTWGGKSRLFNHRVHRALYGSPTHWGEVWDQDAFVPAEDIEENLIDNENDNESVMSDMSGSTESFLDEDNNLKVQFINAHTAETLDKRKIDVSFDHRQEDEWILTEDMWWHSCDTDGNENDRTSGLCLNDNSAKENTDEFDREAEFKSNFETRVEGKVDHIRSMICSNVSHIPPRHHNKQPTTAEPIEAANPHYDTLVKVLTPLCPPQIYPQSDTYKSDGQEDGYTNNSNKDEATFSFDFQPKLGNHVGPSPCQILQALTMSNANDGLNLERLETIGDSFLKYAITSYLFCNFENIHEGKLSHLRSKQVSNVHLYRLGRKRGLGGVMVSAKFEPHDNWLPPCYHIPKVLDKALIHSKLPHNQFSMAQVKALKDLSPQEIETALKTNSVKIDSEFIPYNLVTQQSIPDKSIADCVEALIGAYLTSTGPYGALLFMSWLGMRVLPSEKVSRSQLEEKLKGLTGRPKFYMELPDVDHIVIFDSLKPPKSPLLRFNRDCEDQLRVLLKGYGKFEEAIGYTFRDKSYLLQAFTHASYSANTLTDCYQRLEFLGDAILDYLITRHLYEDPRQHSPGSLTDLRSALVNNTIFASLAVKNDFHKFFRHSSPGLSEVLQKFVAFQEQHGHTLTQDYYLMDEEECEEAEDIEVPKALGDVFESVAGAIFLDSDMSLDAVWTVYYRIMKNEIEQFSQNVPKSPIRELLELEPETAKFGKPEKLWDGRRVRVSVEIIEVGTFRGIGRNYRIAKCTAAKCALRHLRKFSSRHKR